jgi:hypothetical protein
MKGAPALSIRHLAGHEDLQTTLGYMHLARGETERAIELLETPLAAQAVRADGNGAGRGSEHRELIQETGWRRRELNSPRNPKKTLEFRVVCLLGGFILAVH